MLQGTTKYHAMNLEIIHQTHVTQKVEVYECDSKSFSEGEYEKGEYEVQAFTVRGQRRLL